MELPKDFDASHTPEKVSLLRYLRRTTPLTIISALLIYPLIVPFVLLDLHVNIYQQVCFRIYKIQLVRRGDYLIFDRHLLAYLNVLEKLNCVYCSYANGLIAFIREVTARTERYWCPIKHSTIVKGSHAYYSKFPEYGDGEAFRKMEEHTRQGLK